MIRRIAVAVGLVALFNFYIGWRIVARLPWAQDHLLPAWLAVVVFFIVQLAAPFGDRLFLPSFRKNGLKGLARTIDWVSYVAIGLMSVLFLYELVIDVVATAWQIIAPPVDPGRFDRAVLSILVIATAITLLIGIYQALTGPSVRGVEVPLANLPLAFDGFTIAQVSDLHIGPTLGRRYARKVVNIANGLTADLIVLTGDIVDGEPDDLAAEVAPLADLRAPHGTFFVTGNHEHHWNACQWMKAFRRLGARVLNNEHEIIRRAGSAIVVAGVADYSTRGLATRDAFDARKAVANTPPDLVKIVLAHQPESYHETLAAGFDLQLSGHTHAGQYFPFSLLIGFFQRFARGLNRHEKMWIYVNRGTGYWGPPLRTFVPSEITFITLRRQTA